MRSGPRRWRRSFAVCRWGRASCVPRPPRWRRSPSSSSGSGICSQETPRMDLGLKGRAALITGASKGIGKAIALGLAEEGVRLALLARTQSALQAAADEIRAVTGTTVLTLPTDIRDAAAVVTAVER